MSEMPRRIVTGLDDAGKSCVILDGAVPQPGDSDLGMIWRTATLPANNTGRADTADRPFDFALMHSGGSLFMMLDYPPGWGSDGAFWHATDTIDYLIVLSGEVVLMLENEEVVCGAGTCIVDRGVIHAWRNDGAVPARMAIVNLPAHPVGPGRATLPSVPPS